MREVVDISLSGTELVVLSACDTKVGANIVGEGVFALARGFMPSGVRRVIATQWAVDDRPTATLIGRFFAELAAREKAGREFDYVTALLDAKRFIGRGRWPAPE
jgi:CHAT domain-containing protein